MTHLHSILFCIPHAGGSASSFAGWHGPFGHSAEVRPIELAGKGARAGETPYASIQEAAQDVAGVIEKESAGRTWAVLGHSMGALIAYEAVRVLSGRGHPPAQRLIVSGCPAPRQRPGTRPDEPLEGAGALGFLERLDGLPPEIARDGEAAEYFAELVRRDGLLLSEYRYTPPTGPLDCPVTVLTGSADPITTDTDPADWELAVDRPVRMCRVNGRGHFFTMENPAECAALVLTELGWTAAPEERAARLYLDLMKKTLTNVIYEDPPVPSDWSPGSTYDRVNRSAGLDWPSKAHTMVGLRRLDNVQECVERVLRDGVPGDLIETGVWRGGTTIMMRAVLAAWGIEDRLVWVADSFQGMPEPTPDAHPDDTRLATHEFNHFIGVPLETVQQNFRAYGLLDDQVRFLPGWFKDTLPSAPMNRLALLRLDGDLYDSTMDALEHLYPKLSRGGFVIVDDYFLKPCRDAVYDFRDRHGIEDEIRDIDGYGAYWRREN
ncbi:alpha/beta fold hydrolase [Nonomuraea sp. NPDC047529]|uniref:alpha/beta fold hydrolase n=1 Tax=Nonomuraea sp. NPDC047529 TaxID=3155623 RepID=UPI0033EAE2B1